MKSIILALTLGLSTPALAKIQSIEFYRSGPSGADVVSSLIIAEKEIVIVDAQMTRSHAYRVAAKALDTGKRLSRIYITHAHPDHYLGAAVLKDAFPKAEIIATANTVKLIKAKASKTIKAMKKMFGDNLPKKAIIPKTLKSPIMTIEGDKVEIFKAYGDSADGATYLWVPSLKTIIGGDIFFSNAHLWTAETTKSSRQTWAEEIEAIVAKHKPTRIIAGHSIPGAPETPGEILEFMKSYLSDYDRFLSKAKSSEEFIEQMKSEYPDHGLEMAVKRGAAIHFQPKKK